jgi:hypothetical protein
MARVINTRCLPDHKDIHVCIYVYEQKQSLLLLPRCYWLVPMIKRGRYSWTDFVHTHPELLCVDYPSAGSAPCRVCTGHLGRAGLAAVFCVAKPPTTTLSPTNEYATRALSSIKFLRAPFSVTGSPVGISISSASSHPSGSLSHRPPVPAHRIAVAPARRARAALLAKMQPGYRPPYPQQPVAQRPPHAAGPRRGGIGMCILYALVFPLDVAPLRSRSATAAPARPSGYRWPGQCPIGPAARPNVDSSYRPIITYRSPHIK